jgi:hypothetical protein
MLVSPPAARSHNDPTGGPGNLVTPSFMQPSDYRASWWGAYNLDDGSNPRHWGDYSSVTVDPMDDMTFWSVHEYCTEQIRGCARYSIPGATASDTLLATQSSVAQGEQHEHRPLRDIFCGSGFFDPGVCFPKPYFGNRQRGGVTVNSIALHDPTHITLNVKRCPNATPGSRTVTVTNPDGQSAHQASGIIT